MPSPALSASVKAPPSFLHPFPQGGSPPLQRLPGRRRSSPNHRSRRGSIDNRRAMRSFRHGRTTQEEELLPTGCFITSSDPPVEATPDSTTCEAAQSNAAFRMNAAAVELTPTYHETSSKRSSPPRVSARGFSFLLPRELFISSHYFHRVHSGKGAIFSR